MKKFRKVLDGLTTSSPGGSIGSPSGGSAAGTPTATPTPKEIDIQETLVSENFQLCKTGRHGFPHHLFGPFTPAENPAIGQGQEVTFMGARLSTRSERPSPKPSLSHPVTGMGEDVSVEPR
ncbi:syntaxin-binding protein 5-like [Etheostoma spectabile]|uniref:syntaxin-binding protein 5-like n=1 Tax=Etheostoma spectabile TaxID=54343 RepID=UPI0013AFC859|nr:syntaxin-binding protein 5-like [Etheostoma spectabile]